jgi:hypothetical protein
LPLEIRVATTTRGYYPEVDEYDPTIIETPGRERYYIDYGTNFFYERKIIRGIKGNEMKLQTYSIPPMNLNPKFIENKIHERQIVADWTVELGKAFDSKRS